MISVYTYTFLQYTFDWTNRKFNYVIFIVYIIIYVVVYNVTFIIYFYGT